MRQHIKTDILHRSRLYAIEASFKALMETISLQELEVNYKLRHELRKIKRQILLIEELSESFEY